MSLHAFRMIMAASALALTAACAAQGEELESVDSAAQAACEARHLPPGSSMESCLIEMRENIRAARQYQREPPHPTPPPSGARQQRPSGQQPH